MITQLIVDRDERMNEGFTKNNILFSHPRSPSYGNGETIHQHGKYSCKSLYRPRVIRVKQLYSLEMVLSNSQRSYDTAFTFTTFLFDLQYRRKFCAGYSCS